MRRAVLSWSGGKDCAWAWRTLRRADIAITALLTTCDESTGTIPIHNVPLAAIEDQAHAMSLSLRTVPLPANCPNDIYSHRVEQACQPGEALIFGDLFLQDIRDFREHCWPHRNLLFPLWHLDTARLARDMVAAGMEAKITAVDSLRLPPEWIGHAFDAAFLNGLPANLDPCGENGEFHTFVAPRWLAAQA